MNIPYGRPCGLGNPLLGLKVQITDVELGHCIVAILPPMENDILCLVPVHEELLEDRSLEALHDACDLGGLGQVIVGDELVRVGEHLDFFLLARSLYLSFLLPSWITFVFDGIPFQPRGTSQSFQRI